MFRCLSRKKIYRVFLFALYEEAKRFIDSKDFNYYGHGIYSEKKSKSEFTDIVLITGVGGINTVNSLSYLINNFLKNTKVRFIKLINIGTCGSSYKSEETIGFYNIEYPSLELFKREAPNYYIEDGRVKVLDDLKDLSLSDTVKLRTVSSFVEDIKPIDGLDVFYDMEAYAIADFCYKNLPLEYSLDVYKIVSDNGDYTDFKALLDKCSYNMCDFIEQIFYGKSKQAKD